MIIRPGVVVRVGREPDVPLALLEELVVGRGGQLVGVLLPGWAIVALAGDGYLTVFEYQFNSAGMKSSFGSHVSYYA